MLFRCWLLGGRGEGGGRFGWGGGEKGMPAMRGGGGGGGDGAIDEFFQEYQGGGGEVGTRTGDLLENILGAIGTSNEGSGNGNGSGMKGGGGGYGDMVGTGKGRRGGNGGGPVKRKARSPVESSTGRPSTPTVNTGNGGGTDGSETLKCGAYMESLQFPLFFFVTFLSSHLFFKPVVRWWV